MIAIGCDHGAIDLKNQLIEHLKKKGYECNDVGTYTTESCFEAFSISDINATCRCIQHRS